MGTQPLAAGGTAVPGGPASLLFSNGDQAAWTSGLGSGLPTARLAPARQFSLHWPAEGPELQPTAPSGLILWNPSPRGHCWVDRLPRHSLARPPALISCSPQPTSSAHTLRAAQAAGHLPALVLLLRLPDGQGSRAPSLLHPPDANISTQVCSPALPPVPVAQRTYHLPCQTCFPPLASGSGSGSGKAASLAASPLCVPSLRLSTSKPALRPVGLPCSDPTAGLLCTRRGPQLPCAGPCPLSTQHLAVSVVPTHSCRPLAPLEAKGQAGPCY